MFPLKKRKLVLSAAGHVAQGRGIAADYEADFITDYVPFNGTLSNYWGTEGGNWVRLTRPNGDKIEMAHHSKYLHAGGQAKEGQEQAVTGNSGSITAGPHLHIQIINKAGKRLDPEKYDWGKENMQIKTQAKGASRRIILEAADENEWNVLCKIYGLDPVKVDETVS